MSRIGKLPIPLPKGVEVQITQGQVSVKGPKGALQERVPGGITTKVEDGQVVVTRRNDSKQQRAFHGLVRALVANAVRGVTEGFSKELEIHGVGYRAEVKGTTVVFTLGYTHPIEFPIPEGIEIAVDRMRLDRSTTVFVGDLPSVDVEGARAAGLTPILLDRHGVYADVAVPRLRSIEDLPPLIRARR